jgi:ribosomal protein S9
MAKITTRRFNQSVVARKPRPMLRRAMSGTLVLALVFGGGYVWQYKSLEHTAARAEQARVNALKMSVRKRELLAIEARRDALAKAFVEREAIEVAHRAVNGDQGQ